MTAKDQLKILKVGFTIIRKEVIHGAGHTFTRRIKAKTGQSAEWHTLEDKFPSTAALERRMKELLENEKIVGD